LETIRHSLKVPFVDIKVKQSHFIVVAETEYSYVEDKKKTEQENSQDDSLDKLKIFICKPDVIFNEAKLLEKFGKFNTDKVNFVNDVKSFVNSHSFESLKKKFVEGKGTLRFKLNDEHVELH